MSPFKIVEGGTVREDLVNLFVRQSRVPASIEADLRAALAASHATIGKVAELVGRYGGETVKNAMVRVVDASENAFVERLKDIPDGTWSHRSYCEAARPGDNESYCFQINITKKGEQLFIDNRGSSPQAGSTNAPYSVLQGASVSVLAIQMIPDFGGAFGGVHRRISFRPVPGTVCTPEWPAAMSTSGAYANFTLMAAATAAVAKMLSSGSAASRNRSAGMPVPHAYVAVGGGLTMTGRFFMMANLDFHIGSPGGMAGMDGPDAGGHYWVPGTLGMNVEDAERQFPILHLYRRFLDLGADGAGAFRGGLGGKTAAIPWKAFGLAVDLQLNESYPKSAGQAGGNPGSKASFKILHGANVKGVLDAGAIPQELEEMGGARIDPGFKDSRLPVGPNDAYELTWPTASGHGDVLLRDPERVLADIRAKLLDAAVAERVYGVVVDGDRFDAERTRARRRQMRIDRLALANGGGVPGQLKDPQQKESHGVELMQCDGETRFICCACEHELAHGSGNYKESLPIIERPLHELAPEFATTNLEASSKMVHREFLCPACGSCCGTEIARAKDEILWDVRIG